MIRFPIKTHARRIEQNAYDASSYITTAAHIFTRMGISGVKGSEDG